MERSEPPKSRLTAAGSDAAEPDAEAPAAPGRDANSDSDSSPGDRADSSELFWSLPRTPVSLPREGPPAMSPRARRQARDLQVPLQVLPIPAPGRRITEADVLAAAEALKARPQEVSDVVRYPAVREALSTQEAQRARAWSYSQHCIPQLSLETLLPCAAVLSGLKNIGLTQAPEVPDILLKAIAQALCDERFRAFRAIIDGGDRVLRGAIDIGFSLPSLPGDARLVIKGADRLSLAALVERRRSLTKSQDRAEESSAALMSLVFYGGTGIFSGNERVWPGDSAVLAVYDAQPRPLLRPGRSLEIQPAWKICLTVDQRLVDRGTATEFLRFLLRRMELLHCLL